MRLLRQMCFLFMVSVCFFYSPLGKAVPLCATLNGEALYDRYPYSFLYYYGVTVDNALLSVVTLHKLKRWPEHIQSLEFAYTLPSTNIVRRFFYPLVGVTQLAANVTFRNGKDQPTIYEFNPYIMFRWANLPWNHYITTSFAIAEGISYDTSVPAAERKYENEHTKRLLNYLMLEATFALPNHPRWQLIARVHHRSGAYGLYHAGNSGSNDIGVALRYLFD